MAKLATEANVEWATLLQQWHNEATEK